MPDPIDPKTAYSLLGKVEGAETIATTNSPVKRVLPSPRRGMP